MVKCKKISIFIYIFVIFVTCLGIFFMAKIPREGFVSGQCPTTMIKDGSKILLYNPEYAHVPGVNPIEMNNLNEYKEYIEWQRANKLQCPILHLEKVFDTQGAPMYEIRPSFVTELNVGGMNHNLPVVKNNANVKQTMDAALESPPYNCNQYESYDKDNQNIGVTGIP
jgi:hypothetical protein